MMIPDPHQDPKQPIPQFVTIPPQEGFYASGAFLLCASALFGISTLLLIVFSLLEDSISKELHRTLYMTVFHAIGTILYVAAAFWTIADTHQGSKLPVKDNDAKNNKFYAAAALGVIAAVGHLACAAFNYRAWRSR